MKNYSSLLSFLLFFLIIACENADNFNSIPETDPECLFCQNEVAFPDAEKELITLPNGTVVEKFGDLYFYQGDILLTEEQLEKLGSPSNRSTITTLKSLCWPDMKVYYTISPNLPLQNRVTEAIAHWEATTPFLFYPKTANDRNYIEFIWGDGCYSSLGMVGNRQVISLDLSCSTGNAIHEIGHALGLFHEQCRPDRSNFITINYDNIQAGYASQFDIRSNSTSVGTFDFNSVMLYNSWAFSKNGLPTMTKLDGTTFNAQRDGLSTGDLAGIKELYKEYYTIAVNRNVTYITNSSSLKEYYLTATINRPVPVDITVAYDYSWDDYVPGWSNSWREFISVTIPRGATTSNPRLITQYRYNNSSGEWRSIEYEGTNNYIASPSNGFDGTFTYVVVK